MDLAERLATARATAALDRAHPELAFSLLHWVIGTWPDGRPRELFHRGTALLADRYRQLGLDRLLPVDRVWVGFRSVRPGAFGGFHHPDQGYRHVQMGAVVTRYGDLSGRVGVSLDLVALDLLRSYAHDCLHYGSYRVYRLHHDKVVRIRYGINSQDEHGHSYSAPDSAEERTIRNLGVIMEGACDREARSIAHQAAAQHQVDEPVEGIDRLAFRDTTGRLTRADLDTLMSPAQLPGPDTTGYQSAMRSYELGVDARYNAFLVEMAGTSTEHLHALILKAMISGQATELTGWFDQHHGSGSFARLFRSTSYHGPDPS